MKEGVLTLVPCVAAVVVSMRLHEFNWFYWFEPITGPPSGPTEPDQLTEPEDQ